MLQAFLNNIKKENLFELHQKILLGVSGGVDSVVMCELFHQAGFNFAIAHCNFKLRGKDSDADEIFVKNLAKKYKLPFFHTSFNTREYARENKISIEMAARQLRYEWFEKIRRKENYDYIAVAHHKDDVVETFLLNLARGTGIFGLHGIQPKMNLRLKKYKKPNLIDGTIIRPLLFATKKEILNFATQHNLKYREDSSNKSVEIKRNKIRHQIIPLFEQINPSFCETIIKNIQKIRDVEKIYSDVITRKSKRILSKEGNKILINIEKLKPLQIYLYEFLKPYNFSETSIKNIIKSLENISGKQFFSPTHRLIKDRKFLIITPRQNVESEIIKIDEGVRNINIPIKLKFSLIENDKPSQFFKELKTINRSRQSAIRDFNIAFLDYNKLKFPLILRKWQRGDYFYPLGMNKKKKLSDFFIDEKISRIDKENIWLLLAESKIVWIVGHRIDNRFRITNTTEKVFKIERELCQKNKCHKNFKPKLRIRKIGRTTKKE